MKTPRRSTALRLRTGQALSSLSLSLSLSLALSFPLAAAFAPVLVGCQPAAQRAVSLSFKRVQGTPWDAGVWIDEEFIGPLSYVAAHGVRLPEGKHRITVQKEGYFPWDRLVVATDQPIALDVTLEQVPD